MTRARGMGRVFHSTWRDDLTGARRLAKTWAIRYYNRREHRHVTEFGFATEAEAEKRLRTRLSNQERTGETGARTERTTFEDLARMIENDYTVNARDIRRLRVSLTHLRRGFAGDRAIEITEDRIAAYVAQRRTERARPASINRELSALKRCFRLGEQAQAVGRRPHIAMLRENNVRKGFFEEEQFTSVLAHLPEELRPVVQVAAITGWRVHSEILTRQWRHVDGQALRLEPGETKNREGRSFPLDPELRPILEALWRSVEAFRARTGRIVPWIFFHSRDGRPIRRGSFRVSWRDACREAGVPGRLLHDFRRTAVRNLERAGVPRSAAMAMVGHRTESVYRRYAVVDEVMLREGAERLASWRKR